ncbi:conserved hypothetical protein [Ricinus communis]|uniref:SapC family protein n=1 Tax=Ricinus communis TaxID=3988 RepID=B9TDB7_RICCO|nr:conserved hypothetical protein [Ricinus communis]
MACAQYTAVEHGRSGSRDAPGYGPIPSSLWSFAVMNPDSYLRPQLLDSKLHKDYRLRPVQRYAFASHLLSIPLGLNEVVPVSRSGVVAIVRNNSGERSFSVITGFEEGENLLLDANGRWRGGNHVPAFLRRYPFIPVQDPSRPDVLSVGIDLTCPDLNTGNEGEAIFPAYGTEQTPLLARVMQLLEAFHAESRASAALCQELHEAGLLIEREALVTLDGDEQQRRLGGFWIVDEQRLPGLDDELLLRWLRSGVMAVILAHIQSLENLQSLLPLRAM